MRSLNLSAILSHGMKKCNASVEEADVEECRPASAEVAFAGQVR
ncbi:hypothetical protein AGRO_5195 [Agrobacterium sp. ATCC 31749]|nr:hypothetical protein AGRO_5195 [Agrobacterium sp. ATCC 31749]